MNRYQKAIRYTKPLVEIDEKIRHLNERMTTTGLYTRTNQDDGEEEQPPEFNPPPLGDMDPDNFSWPDQGDGNPDNDPNTSALVVTDTLGRELPLFDYLPGVNYSGWNRQPDYSLYGGKKPLGIVFDGRALASTRYFWLGEEGLNFIIQRGAYTTPGPYTDLQKEFSEWLDNIGSQDLTTETIYLWGGIDCLFGSCYGGSDYYPSGTSNTSDPLAERVLYSYTMYVPGTGNRNYASDPGVRSRAPRVNSIISRNDLGDPNFYAGPINTLLNIGKGIADFGQGITNFISGLGSGGPGEGGPGEGGPGEGGPGGPGGGGPGGPGGGGPGGPGGEGGPGGGEGGGGGGGGGEGGGDDNDDRPLIALGYDENGDPTGFTRMSDNMLDQFIDGGGDAAIREGKTLQQVLNQGAENRKNAVTNFTDGVNDGITLVKDVNQTINDAGKNGDIVYVNGEPYIKDGAPGSRSNPIETNLSDSARGELINFLRNHDNFEGEDLQKVVNSITQNGLEQSTGHLGLKGTHNNVTGKPYFDDAGNFHIPDTFGFGGSDDIRDKWGGSIGVVSDVLDYAGNSLGQEGWGEDFETYMDESGPVGDVVELVTGEPLPGKNDPIVHFETVITAEELAGSSFGDRGLNKSEVKESTLFEKWKKKNQKKSESKPSQLQLIYNYFYHLPKTVKKMILMDMKVEAQIMMLPPDQRSFREKELRNTLINKHYEIYMDKKFPENVEQTSRVKRILARNIELSDPKTFKDPKPALTYGKVFGDDPKDKKVKEKDFKKKSAGRFFKTEKKVDTSRTRWLKG